ncbi:DUF2207 family protein [Nocardia arthritidis]|nr:DUF2207 domain-containing protein [Nocardia arthritidis]
MLIIRGAAFGALLLALTTFFVVAPARAQDPPGATIKADIKLSEAGLLEVAETVTVPQGGRFHMLLPLRIVLHDNVERRFTVTDVATTGPGTAKSDGDKFVIDAPPGESTVKYTVHGVVSDAPGTQLFKWTGVLDADVAAIEASVISPSFRMGIADCRIGPAGRTTNCAGAHVEPDGVLQLRQDGLHRGDLLDVTLQLPPGTVPANAEIHDSSRSGAFTITTPVLIAFGVLLLALAAFGGYLVWTRRKDAAAPSSDKAVEPLWRNGNQTQFVSPGAVLPGQAGVLLHASANAAALAATVVDLAVRRYLWIEPIGESDWRITRAHPADEQLRDYERALYHALLPGDSATATISELPGTAIEPVRAALLSDAVGQGLLADRTRRRSLWLGVPLVLAGIGMTIALAVVGRNALVGAALLLGGIAALLLPRYLPARTGAGRQLVEQLAGFGSALEMLRPEQLSQSDRELVFARALPFTVVTGRADNWIRGFRDLPMAAGLYWFGGFDKDRDLRRFATHFPYFITALESSLATQPH